MPCKHLERLVYGSQEWKFTLTTIDKVHRPVIVDTDLSFDDYIALLYLLQHPAIDVRAVTVVNGVAHVGPGVGNADRLLALVGRRDIPVAGGPDGALSGQRAFPGGWRNIMDYGIRLLLPWVSTPVPALSASELICQQCLASDKPVTFVALGPLTNLALALRAEPNLARQIETIYISGGAFNVPGLIHSDLPDNPNRVAEWNFYLDAEAADQVFKSGIPIALVPLDVTHVTGPQPLVFSREAVKRLRDSARSPASRLMARLIHFWQMSATQYPATPLWDAAVAALVVDPAIGTDWRDLAIRVELEPEAVAGQTVIEAGKPANARVCLGGNQGAFEAAYLSIARGAE
jgi:inosine-uridine nucleoside N-ribohydrolase